MNMIQLDMLIVKPNNPQEKGRISSEQVHARLLAMVNRSEDDGYLCDAAAWCSLVQTSDEAVEIDITDSLVGLMQRKVFREYEGRIQERHQ
jgi:hypothetical protein